MRFCEQRKTTRRRGVEVTKKTHRRRETPESSRRGGRCATARACKCGPGEGDGGVCVSCSGWPMLSFEPVERPNRPNVGAPHLVDARVVALLGAASRDLEKGPDKRRELGERCQSTHEPVQVGRGSNNRALEQRRCSGHARRRTFEPHQQSPSRPCLMSDGSMPFSKTS